MYILQALHCWLTRVLYNRRSKFDPLWNVILVAGMQDGEPYLGFVNLQGTAYTDDIMATGMGVDLCLPVMRKAVETKVRCTLHQRHLLRFVSREGS